ncbi:MAG: hypothetical protein HYY84_11905 [Deltaproteobacteria bacterium]|nr:hypothetical protein [Deltaproteobacteria bacterium]
MIRPRVNDGVFVDFETVMTAEYSLRRMTPHAYINDPRFNILSVSIAVGDGEISVFFGDRDGNGGLAAAKKVLEGWAAQQKWFVAHNTNFDALVARTHLGVFFERHFDTVAYLRFLGVKGELKTGAHLVGMEKHVAPSFDVGALAEPSSRNHLARYNAMDVLISREIFRRAIGDGRFPDLEFFVVNQTCRENLAGIRIDATAAKRHRLNFQNSRDQLIEAMAREFPQFDTTKVRSADATKKFCRINLGADLTSIDRKDPGVREAKKANPQLDRFLTLREDVASAARVIQLASTLERGPGRIYAQLTYGGAHTGRFSGGGTESGKFNIQNLPKRRQGAIDAAIIREALVPDENESWVACDLAAIEPRITAFLAQQSNLVDRFAAGDDVYIWFAGLVFPGKKITKGGENNHLRHLAKVGVIGLCYGMGLDRFRETVRGEGLQVDDELVAKVFERYRSEFPLIRAFRNRLWNAFVEAAQNGKTSVVAGCRIGPTSDVEGVGLSIGVLLPTGRSLFYRRVKRGQEIRFGRVADTLRFSDRVEFDKEDDGQPRVRKPSRQKNQKGSGRHLTPNVIVENVVQAVARDILAGQMREIDAQPNLRVVFSVHDEVVVACSVCRCFVADCGESVSRENNTGAHREDCSWIDAAKRVKEMMSRRPSCLDALRDAPIACEVDQVVRQSYRS